MNHINLDDIEYACRATWNSTPQACDWHDCGEDMAGNRIVICPRCGEARGTKDPCHTQEQADKLLREIAEINAREIETPEA